MVVIVFRSKLKPGIGEEFTHANEGIEPHAKSFPGFLEERSYTAVDGERLTVVWYESKEALEAWANDPRHRAIKQKGRENWYEYYKMSVAEVYRTSDFPA